MYREFASSSSVHRAATKEVRRCGVRLDALHH